VGDNEAIRVQCEAWAFQADGAELVRNCFETRSPRLEGQQPVAGNHPETAGAIKGDLVSLVWSVRAGTDPLPV
jgi:hypothetical protein